ncbi:DUF305 domain-containing protein [Streptomyces sp. H10-C2]|uniref:DUF305 domain-containing protein n=1 Tax=unclassified Streptomyces TaxID=2593676 RepID=UPI0024BBC533|nr:MULTISPECIES: DUF305 domain-containing protein [unclassified Streptomyces]MDJ0347320.1 DUF305 domain-containing protein [Streptomyces sp. PH10-H1]MDJ0375117.1 DUF305 domain-containing protein [Streptomyces sp. H10-C2]
MRSHRSLTRRVVIATAVTSGALLLAACGGNSGHNGMNMPSPSTSSTPSASASATSAAHNAADATFAKDMIQHHRQAVEMAGLAPSRASSPDVKDLAEKIKKAQGPEITSMSGWLTAWGEDVPMEMPGMDHSGAMPGMMGTAQMDELKKASGKAFDTAFLTMMIGHHQGALTMAGTEKQAGAYAPATQLASGIVTSQTAEIAQMNKLLGKS